MTKKQIQRFDKKIVWLCFIFCIVQLIYLFVVYPYPMANDAIIYKSNSIDIMQRGVAGNTQYPFLYSWIQVISFWLASIGGSSEIWMLIINVVLKTLFLVPTYALLRKCLDKYAFECTVMIAFTPIYFVWSRVLLAENLLCPLLLICILYHIVYRPDNEHGINIVRTIVAALLALSLVYTKYLTIVLLPVFCLFWSWGYIKKPQYNVRKFLLLNISYTIITTLCMFLYSFWFAYASKCTWTFDAFKSTIGLNSGGSSPETVGYSLLVDSKWIVCYLLYMLLGASIQVILMLLLGDVKKLKKNKGLMAFFAWISMALCYVAARHSSLVGYNEGYKMYKLLGRYVAYFTPICVIALFLVMANNIVFNKRRMPICICAVGITVVLPYMILYRRLIWAYEQDWLDYARGWENVGFSHMGVFLCAIYCVTIFVVVRLLVRKCMKTAVVIVCACMSIHAMVAVIKAVDTTPYMSECSDIHQFIDAQGETSVGILCNDAKKHNDMVGLNIYFSDNEEEWYRHNINGIYYPASSRAIKPELEYYYMLYSDDVDSKLLEEKGIVFLTETNTKYFFLKWEEEIFSKVERDIKIGRNEEKIILEFMASDDCILYFANGFWPVENIDEVTRRASVKYPFNKGENYVFAVYDFERLEKFIYEIVW